jgi:hypothetical protein
MDTNYKGVVDMKHYKRTIKHLRKSKEWQKRFLLSNMFKFLKKLTDNNLYVGNPIRTPSGNVFYPVKMITLYGTLGVDFFRTKAEATQFIKNSESKR